MSQVMLWSAAGQAGLSCSHSRQFIWGNLLRAATLHRQQGMAVAAHVCPARLSLLDLKVDGCQPSRDPTVL